MAEEPTNSGEDYDGAGVHDVERANDLGVIFGVEESESEEVTGFMLKTPGEVEQQLATFQPEETSVDTGEVQLKEEEEKQAPSLLVSYIYTPISRWITH